MENRMCVRSDKLKDVAMVEKIPRSMTKDFDYVLYSIVKSKNTNKISIDELQSLLLVNEERMKDGYVEEQALHVSINGKFLTWKDSSKGQS